MQVKFVTKKFSSTRISVFSSAMFNASGIHERDVTSLLLLE